MTIPLTELGIRYQVYITPRINTVTYGTEVEVTSYILVGGINSIKRAIDSQDYAIGVYFYNDLELIGTNDDGYFNENDTRSIFPYLRDKAKVRIVYENSGGQTITYRGLLNEEATRIDSTADTISFRVLSLDSIIRNTLIASGIVTDGELVSGAIVSILNDSVIASILTVDASNITPAYDFAIDSGAAFTNQNTQTMLNLLLLASNSVMTVDDSLNVVVKARTVSTGDALVLYGPFDEQRRQNILSITNYNTGLQRTFTAVQVEDANSVKTVEIDAPQADFYGYRQTSVSLPFLTDLTIASDIASTLLDEFKYPKIELEIEVPTSVAKDSELLDPVIVNWPLRVYPDAGNFLPVIGVTKIGETTQPLPNTKGSFSISPSLLFKIIEINENPSTFTTRLKLRQAGITSSDGEVSAGSVVGFAIIGISTIQAA